MAFEYKGWSLGFTLDSPNRKGNNYCSLSRRDVIDYLYLIQRGDSEGVVVEHIGMRKGVAPVDARNIYNWLVELNIGEHSV